MATNSATGSFTSPGLNAIPEQQASLLRSALEAGRWLVTPLASLRLTVVLLAMAVFIVFVGTLAQSEKNMVEVIDAYFRSTIAWIELRVFFPPSFFPRMPQLPDAWGFWFPGGFLIGILMAVNLLAAHLVRFGVQARGIRLASGLAILALGLLMTWWVVDTGHNRQGLQGLREETIAPLWPWMKHALAVLAAGALGWLRFVRRPYARAGLAVAAAALGGTAAGLFATGDNFTPSWSSQRILWQLIIALAPAVTLLTGSILVFRKRAGIVVLHLGIALMMFSEFFVSRYAVEGRMTIREGETVNFVRDIRAVELAVIDPSDAENDQVITVPQPLLREGETIRHPELPFDIRVVRYLKNAVLRDVRPGEDNLSDTGVGQRFVAEVARASSGADTSGQVDLAAMYAELLDKDSGQSLGTVLLSQILSSQDIPEKVTVDGKPYDVSLRFKRNYKDYRIALKDVRKDDYLGTSTPRDYSSYIRLVDTNRGVDSDFRIWMNNPLRYAGETFYQSGYNRDRDGVEVTDLQVVTNTGWMMPYVGCMFVVVGMLAHFGLTLERFLTRRAQSESKALAEGASDLPVAAAPAGPGTEKTPWKNRLYWAVPVAVVVLAGLWIVSKARPSAELKAGMNLDEFGRLPVVYQARVKPLDTLARNSLQIISNRTNFKDRDGKTQPAIRWLLDVIAGTEEALEHRVFRIENLDVLETLGLTPRKGFRYAVNEFRDNIEQFEEQVEQARQMDVAQLSAYQRKLIELDRRLRRFTLLQASFRTIPYPPVPSDEEFRENPEQARAALEQIKRLMSETPRLHEMLARMEPPLAVPVGGEEGWLPYATAWNRAYLQRQILGQEPEEITVRWNRMLVAYASGDTKAFNDTVAQYQASLEDDPPGDARPALVGFEFFFNHFAPFYHAAVLYLLAFVLAVLGWLLTPLGWRRTLNHAALGLIVLTLLLHTFALAGRIAISGRPPVTNLYSSAVFIGWATVLLGIGLEWLYRLGIGNVIAAVSGFGTLLIAHFLSLDGDTFTVLQAVLDTQFWLATHVVCITLGYATTFVAGLLGVAYIVARADRWPGLGRELTRMTYGTLCFAIFFSFFGTVLGGLWADDSWGRFWGWDPKENGALMIVLWTALILHARWGGLVKQRGLAVLAVGGNIVTAWSWFGVNELGVGLHSYGFTEGVLRALGLFCLSQLAVMVWGMIRPSVSSPAVS
jgi:ABC-type transport system involved in cytochrome c biogenesis permease subunit